jgi:hypothetical protein
MVMIRVLLYMSWCSLVAFKFAILLSLCTDDNLYVLPPCLIVFGNSVFVDLVIIYHLIVVSCVPIVYKGFGHANPPL